MTPTAKAGLAAIVLSLSGAPLAADPPSAWESWDTAHPVLGNVRAAVLKAPVETVIGGAKVYTRATLSCQKASKKIAIELTNGTSPDAQNALKPNKDPRLVCKRPNATQDLKAEWDVAETGAPFTRDISAAALRQCASLAMLQEVALPQGWAQKSSKLELEIQPASKDLDSVFAACGGAPVMATPVAMKTDLPWQAAKVITGSKTNVRGEPNTTAAVVAQLEPGTAVRVQKTANEWWRAKAEKDPGFEGYIRNDRLLFK
jgi:uncharacterized protein YgiM (DUF1202 family)